jgi:hypothetical protein
VNLEGLLRKVGTHRATCILNGSFGVLVTAPIILAHTYRSGGVHSIRSAPLQHDRAAVMREAGRERRCGRAP